MKAASKKFLADYVRIRSGEQSKYQMALRAHVVPQIGDILADALSREQVLFHAAGWVVCARQAAYRFT